MTTNVLPSELKKITTDWFQQNEMEIAKGSTVSSPSELLAYERRLFLLLVELGALIIALVLKNKLQDKEFQKTTGEAFMKKYPEKYRHLNNYLTPVRTFFGNIVKVRTRYYVRTKDGRRRSNGRNGTGVFPALEALGIYHGVTPALGSEIARVVAEGPSMSAAVERLGRRGILLDIKALKRVSETIAQMALDLRGKWLQSEGKIPNPLIPPGESLRGLRVLIGVDGGRTRIRTNKRGRIPMGYKRHGYDTDWREPKLLVIRPFDETGKVLRDLSPVYDGTMANADAIFTLLRAHLLARNIDEALEIVCVCDGALWIWERMEPMLLGLGIDPAKIHYVVDYFHAVEHLTTVVDGKRCWSQKKRTRWLNRMKSLLIDGNIEAICSELDELAIGRNADIAKKEIQYFQTNKERMRYKSLLEKNLPIGSGATESAVRQTINMRLKGAGMFWLIENAEGLLHLRCYLKAGRWDAIENAVFTTGIVVR